MVCVPPDYRIKLSLDYSGHERSHTQAFDLDDMKVKRQCVLEIISEFISLNVKHNTQELIDKIKGKYHV